MPAIRTLEGVKMTLEERLAEWPKQWLREGREQVVEQLRRTGANVPPEDTNMTLEERLAEWPKQWLQQGIEQGLEHERVLLRRQVAFRFGAETAERLSGVLARITDPEGLADVGEWLVRCETGSEFLARVDPAAGAADRRGDGGNPHGNSQGN